MLPILRQSEKSSWAEKVEPDEGPKKTRDKGGPKRQDGIGAQNVFRAPKGKKKYVH